MPFTLRLLHAEVAAQTAKTGQNLDSLYNLLHQTRQEILKLAKEKKQIPVCYIHSSLAVSFSPLLTSLLSIPLHFISLRN